MLKKVIYNSNSNNGILPSHKKKCTNACYNIGDMKVLCWDKPETKGHILNGSTYLKHFELANETVSRAEVMRNWIEGQYELFLIR